MTDYTKATGTRGTMMIRDTGSSVEFWIKSSSASVFMYGKDWSYSTPQGGYSGQFDYSGDEWKRLGSKTVTDSGTVSFTIQYTGASFFGGPTTLSVNISRAERPSAPSGLSISDIGYTSGRVNWSNRGNSNGGTFRQMQVQVSSTPQSGSGDFKGTVEVTATTTSNDLDARGLSPGTVYDAHVRQQNSVGWGPWSSIISFQTLWGASVRVSGVWKKAVPYVKVKGVWKVAIPYVKKSGTWRTPS